MSAERLLEGSSACCTATSLLIMSVNVELYPFLFHSESLVMFQHCLQTLKVKCRQGEQPSVKLARNTRSRRATSRTSIYIVKVLHVAGALIPPSCFNLTFSIRRSQFPQLHQHIQFAVVNLLNHRCSATTIHTHSRTPWRDDYANNMVDFHDDSPGISTPPRSDALA